MADSIDQAGEAQAAGAAAVLVRLGGRALDGVLALLLLLMSTPWLLLRGLRARRGGQRLLQRAPRLGRGRRPFRMLALAQGGASGYPVALLNVLRGEMALAGPRPRAPQEHALLPPAESALLLSVRPGLWSPYRLQQRAGIAAGSESAADCAYVRSRSLAGDIGLLLRVALNRVLTGPENLPCPGQLDLFSIALANTSRTEALDWMVARAQAGERTQVAFANPDCLNLALEHPLYADVLRSVERVFPDGIGIKLAARMKGVAMRDNINGTDLFPDLCREAARLGLSIYLLGARPGVAAAAAAAMGERYQGLRIAGVEHGYYDPADEAAVVERINAAGADMLLVAFGAPRQELFLAKWREQLTCPLRLGVGGLFDFYSGRIPRAPLWMREVGMEWVWRLLQEPGRMWRRYLIGNPLFLYRVWREHRGAVRSAGLAAFERLPPGLRGSLPMVWVTNVLAAVKRQRWNLTVSSGRALKRGLDVLVAGGMLLALAPLFAVVALAIRLESPGSVFFQQQRVGLWGRTFPMWKFRSMFIDAEARKQALLEQNQMAGGVIFKMKRDPRITRVGRVIRRLSIDELPQLWNVLRGDMTLVGPRPSLPQEVGQYSLDDRARLDARPGLTCIWQVSGRSDIPFKQQVAMDVQYIQTRSLGQDLSLLARTIPAVVSGRGAY